MASFAHFLIFAMVCGFVGQLIGALLTGKTMRFPHRSVVWIDRELEPGPFYVQLVVTTFAYLILFGVLLSFFWNDL